jgi:hypothetical protein
MKQVTQSLALIAALMTTAAIAVASPVGGTAQARGALDSGERRAYTIHLAGGEEWNLRAEGFGNGDLDCFVYDEDGILVGRDNDDTQLCIISDTPKWTGPFSVVLVNAGDAMISYRVEVR